MLPLDDSAIDRFWSKVDRSGGPDACWPWLACKFSDGYGAFGTKGKVIRTHRVAWMIANGTITGNLFVCHSCDNRRCCNPSHLSLGTHADNMAGSVARGRFRGENHGMHKLTDATVLEIRQRFTNGETIAALARELRLAERTIGRAVRGESWKHVA